jgi:hypothetical protein
MSEGDIDAMMEILFDEFVDKATKSSEYEPNEYGEQVEDLTDNINATRLRPVMNNKESGAVDGEGAQWPSPSHGSKGGSRCPSGI